MVLTRGDWRVRFGTEALAAKEEGSERFVDLAAIRSGYLAFEPTDPSQADKRRLVPVTVVPDRAPTIRIEAPAKDLLLPDATPTVRITATATDDLGLRSLDLRYTRISGSGEQFEFQEGTIPIAVAQESPRSWKARAELPLPKLSLNPGDSVVYRVVGRDQRAGDAGMATSDTFFIEIAGPNQVALPGFELPPEQERYAMSQQMIVLKLERLRAREKSLDRPALEAEVATIAAEQRAVKSNFIFLTGGTVEDEEEEAEHSHEIQEGRLENTARREIGIAIQHMTLTEQALAQVSTTRALPPARDAVEALQRAFGRNRYFLKTLPVRSRVDPGAAADGRAGERFRLASRAVPVARQRPVGERQRNSGARARDGTGAASGIGAAERADRPCGAGARHRSGVSGLAANLACLPGSAGEDARERDGTGDGRQRDRGVPERRRAAAGAARASLDGRRVDARRRLGRGAAPAMTPVLRMLRLLAVTMAIAGVIDPSWTTSRQAPVVVAMHGPATASGTSGSRRDPGAAVARARRGASRLPPMSSCPRASSSATRTCLVTATSRRRS